MELSDEVCVKIKSAIRAKLKELGIDWDQELPDYVMVLIKNRKSHEEMEADLNIFLGDHTISFTEWLLGILKKLDDAVTSKAPVKKKDDGNRYKPKRRVSGENQLGNKKLRAYSGTRDEKSVSPLLRKNGYESEGHRKESSRSFNSSSNDQRKSRERIHIDWADECSKENKVHSKSRRDRSRSTNSEGRRRSRSKSEPRSRSMSRVKEERTGGDRERRQRGDGREQRPRDARELIRGKASHERPALASRVSRRSDYDKERNYKEKPHKEEKLPSLVKVTPRPVRPASMQPCSNLILKAVAEAQKSIAVTSLPQPEDKLGFDDEKKPPPKHKKPILKKRLGKSYEPLSVTLLNDRVTSTKEVEEAEEEVVSSSTFVNEEPVEQEKAPLQSVPEIPRFTINLQSDDDSNVDDMFFQEEQEISTLPETYSDTAVQIGGYQETYPTNVQVESCGTQVPEPIIEPMEVASEVIEMETEVPTYPVYRFDRSRLGPKVVPDTETVLSCLAPPSQPLTKTIMNSSAFGETGERPEDNEKLIKCKFWPNCETGDACRFYHPKGYCRTLPNCKFGQKCLYYHPPCKFGDKCLNVACPYTHNLTAISVKGKPFTKTPAAPSNGQICIFFPNCTKPFCPFQHYAAPGSGIPCKYGSTCSKLCCEFDHPQTTKNPYKWTAQTSE